MGNSKTILARLGKPAIFAESQVDLPVFSNLDKIVVWALSLVAGEKPSLSGWFGGMQNRPDEGTGLRGDRVEREPE
jgi:hypothetical protein